MERALAISYPSESFTFNNSEFDYYVLGGAFCFKSVFHKNTERWIDIALEIKRNDNYAKILWQQPVYIDGENERLKDSIEILLFHGIFDGLYCSSIGVAYFARDVYGTLVYWSRFGFGKIRRCNYSLIRVLKDIDVAGVELDAHDSEDLHFIIQKYFKLFVRRSKHRTYTFSPTCLNQVVTGECSHSPESCAAYATAISTKGVESFENIGFSDFSVDTIISGHTLYTKKEVNLTLHNPQGVVLNAEEYPL